MKQTERILWAVAILITDLAIFFLPLMAFLSIYILLARPVWFKNWINALYED